jgi:outer membrane lipoprotein-sorting protein
LNLRARRAACAWLVILAAATSSAAADRAAAQQPKAHPGMEATLEPGRDDPRATALLRAAMDAGRTTSYVAQVQTIRFGPSGTVATITKEEHLAPDETHKLYIAPENVYGDSVVIHGTQTYSYDTKHRRVVVSTAPSYDPQTASNSNLGLLLANYRPVIGNPEIVAGRPAIPCSLLNRYTGERVMQLWIDAETRLILQKETYHANGTIGSRVQFENIRYTKALPAALFATPIPAGYQVVRATPAGSAPTDIDHVLKEAGFAPAGPRYLPDGFTIMSADVTTVKGVRTLQLLYSDGVRSLSLFENAQSAAADFGHLRPMTTKIENRDALYVNDGPTTLLSWKDRGLAFALVGDLDLKELKAIAASVS